MTPRRISLVAAISATLACGSAFAAQVPYAIFNSAGAVSNFTSLTPEGSGCTADCTGINPVLGGHGYAFGAANDVTFTWDGTVFTHKSVI